MGKYLRVLIIEDSELDAELLLRELRQNGYSVEFQRVQAADTMRQALIEKTWDFVLSDYNMPGFNALEALQLLKAHDLDLPFVIISGSVGEETAVHALKAGAHDFLVKGNYFKLGSIMERELLEAEKRRESKRVKQTAEELFGTAFHQSPVGICITSLDGKLQTVSQSLLVMLGYTRAELEGKHWNDITHPDDLEIAQDVIAHMISGEVPSVSFEKRYLHKSGKPIWAFVSSSLLRDSLGNPIHFITHILDLTERRRVEERIRIVIEAVPNAIVMVDGHGKIILANLQVEKFFGYARDELIGQAVEMLVPERYRAEHQGNRIRFMCEPQARPMGMGRDLFGVRKDGSEFPVEIGLNPIETEQGSMVLASIVDITNRKQTENEILRLSRLYATLSQINQIIVRVKDQQELFESICKVAVEFGRFRLAWFGLLDSEKGQVTVVAEHGDGKNRLPFTKIYANEAPFDRGITALAIRSGSPQFSHDIQTDPRMSHWREGNALSESHAAAALPILQSGRLIGLLSLYSADIGLFAVKEERDLLEEMATDISFALDAMQVEAERQRAEQELRQSNARFMHMVDSNVIGIIVGYASGKVILANDYYLQILGVTRQEFLEGKVDWREFTPPEWLPMDEKAIQELRERGVCEPYEKEYMHADGTRVAVYIADALLPGPDEQIIAFVLDITERKRAENSLKESEERFSTAFFTNPVAQSILSQENSEILLINDACCRLFGYSREELSGATTAKLNLWEDPADRRAAVEELQRTGHLLAREATIRVKSGEIRTVIVAIESILWKGTPCLISSVYDITERKLAEEMLHTKNEELKAMSQQLWQAAKLATMGELAASIAHELNNPLATVSLRTEMLMTQFSPDDPQSKSLQIIDSEVKRMSSLVANLLQFSRHSSSQVSTLKVNDEIVNTLELIQYHLRKNAIRIVQEFSAAELLIQADRQQLRQVLLNLFTNAADAMPLGGILTIRTRTSDKTDTGNTAPLHRSTPLPLGLPVSSNLQVFLEVSDTGEGISQNKIERVWEPFYTTKPEGKGTGLGLAICRRIIQEHGGTIEIISDGIPGHGTTVRLSLPAVKGA